MIRWQPRRLIATGCAVFVVLVVGFIVYQILSEQLAEQRMLKSIRGAAILQGRDADCAVAQAQDAVKNMVSGPYPVRNCGR